MAAASAAFFENEDIDPLPPLHYHRISAPPKDPEDGERLTDTSGASFVYAHGNELRSPTKEKIKGLSVMALIDSASLDLFEEAHVVLNDIILQLPVADRVSPVCCTWEQVRANCFRFSFFLFVFFFFVFLFVTSPVVF